MMKALLLAASLLLPSYLPGQAAPYMTPEQADSLVAWWNQDHSGATIVCLHGHFEPVGKTHIVVIDSISKQPLEGSDECLGEIGVIRLIPSGPTTPDAIEKLEASIRAVMNEGGYAVVGVVYGVERVFVKELQDYKTLPNVFFGIRLPRVEDGTWPET